MEIRKSKDGGTIRYKIIGDISSDEAQEFTNVIMKNIAKKNPRIEVDLSECLFMCSNGLGALAAALMVARSRGGDILITAVSDNVRKLLDLTTFSSIIEIK